MLDKVQGRGTHFMVVVMTRARRIMRGALTLVSGISGLLKLAREIGGGRFQRKRAGSPATYMVTELNQGVYPLNLFDAYFRLFIIKRKHYFLPTSTNVQLLFSVL